MTYHHSFYDACKTHSRLVRRHDAFRSGNSCLPMAAAAFEVCAEFRSRSEPWHWSNVSSFVRKGLRGCCSRPRPGLPQPTTVSIGTDEQIVVPTSQLGANMQLSI
jgi:hypothetical protein